MNPTPADSVYVVFSYTSSDGCPDFYLVKDSVIDNKVYVSKKRIPNTGMMCIQVISKFSTKINIGTLRNGAQIYFDGQLIKIIERKCEMDRVGVVTSANDIGIYIQEANTRNIFEIRNVKIATGTSVKFKGTIIQCITTPCYNTVECYEIISAPPCVMDKKGIVIFGVDGCDGQLFIREYVPNSTQVQVYAIKPGDNLPKLKPGDEVKFGGFLKPDDPNTIGLCKTVGVATCYEIIQNTNGCVMTREGVVVQGIDGCTGQIFIQEYSPISSQRQLFTIKPNENQPKLKPGDKVVFGGYLLRKDSLVSILCPTVGVATCYQLKETSDDRFTLAGYVWAGNEKMKSGVAVLFRKGDRKAFASHVVEDGLFAFAGLKQAEYTVYIIPDKNLYGNYLPVFYLNKLLFKNADYVLLNNNINNINIRLLPYNPKVGNGRIYGNIFYESTNLRDTVLSESNLRKITANVDANIAENMPVFLFDSFNVPVAWTMTDEYGNYSFENIAIDTYKVVSETPSALAESIVRLTPNETMINADLIMKSQEGITDITELENNGLNIYPNPITDFLTIHLKNDEEIQIFNTMGQLLLRKQLNAGVNVLDVSAMKNGIYYTKVGAKTMKLIKK
jgi:hypothetical protein